MSEDSVEIFEVGPRDGFQNEKKRISLQTKIDFIHALVHSGVRNLEVGAFVRADRVPQMATTRQLAHLIHIQKIKMRPQNAWFLVPNLHGLKAALDVGVTRIALFTAASETFTQENIGMSIRDSLKEFKKMISDTRLHSGSKVQFRGYVSTAFGCPFEGRISTRKAMSVIEKLVELGVDQVSVGDTIGVATPSDVIALMRPALRLLGCKKTAVHFHDTRGTALANTLRSIDLGVRIIDSSAGGLGGCPFAPGAAGNLATEDLVYMLNGMKMRSGIDLDKLCKASIDLSKKIKRPLTSRYLQTYLCNS